MEAEATEPTESPVADSYSEMAPEDAPSEMTEADAKKIGEDLRFGIWTRPRSTSLVYLPNTTTLPSTGSSRMQPGQRKQRPNLCLTLLV